MKTQQIAAIFEALASPIRLDIYRLLVKAEPDGKVAGHIATELGVPPSNLSFHLKALVVAGLLVVVQEGRFVRYRAHMAVMDSVIGFLTSECCNGMPERCGRCAAPIHTTMIALEP